MKDGQWWDVTWSPISGCTPISEGCQNCYAKRMAQRLKGRYGYPADDPFRPGVMHNDVIHKPAHGKKPRKIFVCSMGDIFHKDVDWNHLFAVWQMMGMIKRHTFIVLTKRPENALSHLTGSLGFHLKRQDWCRPNAWPLPNVWLGVTAENQQRADERIPILLQIPAAVRFVSVEPMLGPVKLSLNYHSHGIKGHQKLDWVICGGESGPGARPMNPDWVRSLRDQCQGAGVPFFFKQWGGWAPTDKNWGNVGAWSNNKFYYECHPPDYKGIYMEKVVKKKAGCLLDGREWNEYPKG